MLATHFLKASDLQCLYTGAENNVANYSRSSTFHQYGRTWSTFKERHFEEWENSYPNEALKLIFGADVSADTKYMKE